VEELKLNVNTRSMLSPNTAKCPVINWKNRYRPLLNGNELLLENNEMCRSLACSPDGTSFVIGTDWNIYCFNNNGTFRWKSPAPGIVWNVNISGDGRIVVATHNDGTIRWYRLYDGWELFALFPHADKKQWVLWTPDGYYASSEGSDTLIGWHVNQGLDKEALFLPAFAFSDIFNKPEMIGTMSKLLLTDREMRTKMKMAYPDIRTMLLSFQALTEVQPDKTAKDADIVAQIYTINSASGEVVVAVKDARRSLSVGESVYVSVDGKEIQMKVFYPMLSVAKCKIIKRNEIGLIQKGMAVYRK
jgi:hypothetical protein